MRMLRWLLLLALLGLGPAAAQKFQADSGLSVFSEIVPANTTAVQVCKSSCYIYGIDTYSNNTTLAYIRLFNASTATCGTTTNPQWRGMIPFGSSSSGGGFIAAWINGDSYSNGAWMCVTGAISDTDTTSPAANSYIVNIHFKTISQTNP